MSEAKRGGMMILGICLFGSVLLFSGMERERVIPKQVVYPASKEPQVIHVYIKGKLP